MSDHKIYQEQEKEIQAGIGSRLQNGRIDYEARLEQNMERARLQAAIAKAGNANANSSQDTAGNSTAVAEQTQQVLTQIRPIAVRLWEHFENAMDDFNGDVGFIWNEFTAMTPWEKAITVLVILALIALIGTLGYFSWQFVCYVWPHLVNFARQYGKTIAKYGTNFLNFVENSDIYRNFVSRFQNNDEDIDANSGLGAVVVLGMPPMLALYKSFFSFLSMQGSG